MSSQAIEARSLSSLTTLASNPPAYPRNPTHVRHDPLVLYIARVPGSRDVFLTPMKPRERVVTAEDIQSCLYYIHVEQPDDARLVPPPPEHGYPEQNSASLNLPPVPPIQRKAIPGGPSGPVRKPVAGTLAPVQGFQNRQNISASNYSQPGLLGPDYHAPRRSFDSVQSRSQNDRPSSHHTRRLSEQIQRAGPSLTLIRRDPVSGAQWNVARIEDPPVLEVSSIPQDPATRKKTGAPIFIEISNPGYSKFLNQLDSGAAPPLPSRNTDLSVRSHNPVDGPGPRSAGMPSDGQFEVGNTFRRRLWMEGWRFSNSGFGHQRNSSHDSNTGRQSPRTSFEGRPQRDHRSGDHHSSEDSPFVTRSDQAYGTIQTSDKVSTFRGYVFMSPWNGRCEFTTGAGGGTLKCRHIVPGLQGASPMAMPVSELRFNLPSSSKASTPRDDESSKRSSFFRRPRHSRNQSTMSDVRRNSSEDAGSPDRLDLSLGQEFAGGGFGGRQAKLGKLIVEDEGLKMLDLLVAANVALWWRAYQKGDARS
ncbi:hypothetical protein BDV95DRAFT_556700 [Massariosphaeria phaeospora]|uniref:Oxidoreductase-like protein n=1 Tax=Massariosphaeria phaeospora TaxID=100035 RepID=A0A7C8MP40_9PLEO|nr:hypothetical protein BDV95DRAFT_556700 [Massariosphaeria phaeospora]